MSDDKTGYDPRRVSQHPIVQQQQDVELSVDIGRVYYPCTGNVDLKTYVEARMYAVGFRRLYDEWVALGRPHLETGHWPRIIGHPGLPTSPEDFNSAASYYDRKIFAMVSLDVQGKPADRNRPIDDFLVSMLMLVAIVTSDIAVHRLRLSQPEATEVTVRSKWSRSFSLFLKEVLIFFNSERTICNRLSSHHCCGSLMWGQAFDTPYPKLVQQINVQISIFRNLFPSFGHFSALCAAAEGPDQWKRPGGPGAEASRSTEHGQEQRFQARGSSSTGPGIERSGSGYVGSLGLVEASGGSAPFHINTIKVLGEDDAHADGALESQRLQATRIPDEIKGRSDLFFANLDQAIHSEIPLERVIQYVDSRPSASASASASSVSTPLSIPLAPPLQASYNATFASAPSISSTDMDWPSRQAGNEGRHEFQANTASLSLRPPLHSHFSWSEGAPRGDASDDQPLTTPEEMPSLQAGRLAAAATFPYYSSLPTTPTEILSPDQLFTPLDGSLDGRMLRHTSGFQHRESSSTGSLQDSRRRSRAEQNREKMKAYHRRVMQQREALTSILAELSSQVGPIDNVSGRARSGHSPMFGQDGTEGLRSSLGADGTGESGRGGQESGWSISLRNKQKQESKARLRKREIDQVYELSLYADYAVAGISKVGSGEVTAESNSNAAKSSPNVAVKAEGGVAAAWTAVETSLDTVNSIARVFWRHRGSWVALISAEQRLYSEVAKLQTKSEGGEASESTDSNGGWKGIKSLIEQLQIQERSRGFVGGAGVRDVSSSSSSLMVYHAQPGSRSSGNLAGYSNSDDSSRMADVGRNMYEYASSVGQMMGTSDMATNYTGAQTSPNVFSAAQGSDETDYFSQERRRYTGRLDGTHSVGPYPQQHGMQSFVSSVGGDGPLDQRMGQANGMGRMAMDSGAGAGTTPVGTSMLTVEGGGGYSGHGLHSMEATRTMGQTVHRFYQQPQQQQYAPQLQHRSSLPHEHRGSSTQLYHDSQHGMHTHQYQQQQQHQHQHSHPHPQHQAQQQQQSQHAQQAQMSSSHLQHGAIPPGHHHRN